METHLITEGFKFMILGMSMVFIFLAILVFTMNLQNYIIQEFFPEAEQEPEPIPVRIPSQTQAPSTVLQNIPSQADDTEVIAAITAAMNMHRRRG
jgi:oxaloacetate decarboxylase gamma subunit